MSDTIFIDEIKIRKAFAIIKSINHPLRVSLLELILTYEQLNVTDIYTKLRIEQPVASQHLTILKKANLIHSIKDGKKVTYSVNKKKLKLLIEVSNLLS